MPHYRLTDHQGAPHPVLDDLYDSLDAAWCDALAWWDRHVSSLSGRIEPMAIGVEVSTSSGAWRTLRPPGKSQNGIG